MGRWFHTTIAIAILVLSVNPVRADIGDQIGMSAVAVAQRDRGLIGASPAADQGAAQVVVIAQDADGTGLGGPWHGTYNCGQGPTALLLTITELGGGDITAEFSFSATPENPSVPSGSFSMTGTYDADRRSVELEPGEWIERPAGYQTVGIRGRTNNDLSTLVGKIEAAGCGSFNLTRDAPDPVEAEPVAADVASADISDTFVSSILTPEGVRIGMPVGEAVSLLQSKGFVEDRTCRFERYGETTDNRYRLTLNVSHTDPTYQPTHEEQFASPETACPQSNRIVTGIRYEEQLTRDYRPADAEAEINRLVETLGPYNTCRQLYPADADGCVWKWPAPDPNVRQLTVEISKSWGRRVDLTHEPLEVFAEDPAKVATAHAATAEALSICENYQGGSAEMIRALYDCQCIADRVGQAYARNIVDAVTVQTIDRYTQDCPANHEALSVYFYEQCLSHHGSIDANREWAVGGGCICYGDHSVTGFAKDPRPSYPHLASIGAGAQGACGVMEGIVPAEYASLPPPGEDGGSDSAAGVDSAEPVVAVIGDAPAGIRPLEMWAEGGRPIVYNDFTPRTAMDAAFDHRTQAMAASRYVNLLLLASEPGLADDVEALRVLIAENLPYDRRPEFLNECDRPESLIDYCSWAGADEFARRALQEKAKAELVPSLVAFAQSVPGAFIFVEQIRRHDYDAAAGGFPLDRGSGSMYVAGDRWGFRMPGQIGAGGILAFGDNLALPTPWTLSPSQAEGVLQALDDRKIGQIHNDLQLVDLAWTLRVIAVQPPLDENLSHFRELIVEASDARVFADIRLTQPLASLLSPVETASTAEDVTSTSSDPVAFVIAPFEHADQEGMLSVALSTTRNIDSASLRYLNLIILGLNPNLLDDPDNALLTAHQNVIGLTLPSNRPEGWVGDNEFARTNSESTFMQHGKPEVMALAPSLPQEVILHHMMIIGPYSFDDGVFPIHQSGMPRSEGSGEAQQVLVRYSAEVLDRIGIVMQWQNGDPPEVWRIGADEAQGVAGLLESHGNGNRNVYADTRVIFHDLRKRDSGGWLFDTEIIAVDLYADEARSQWVGSLALN